MKIEIISVGKVRGKYITLGIEEFSKRLQPYCTLKLTEVRDEAVPDHLSGKESERIKIIEGERVRDIERIGDYFKNNIKLIDYKLSNKVMITEQGT